MLPESNLTKRTRVLLQTRPRGITYAMVAEGSGLNIEFIKGLGSREVGDLSVNRVTVLYEYLTGKKLHVD